MVTFETLSSSPPSVIPLGGPPAIQQPAQTSIPPTDSIASLQEEESSSCLCSLCCCAWEMFKWIGESLWSVTKCLGSVLWSALSCVYSFLTCCFCGEASKDPVEEEQENPRLVQNPPPPPLNKSIQEITPQENPLPPTFFTEIMEPSVEIPPPSSKKEMIRAFYTALRNYLDTKSDADWQILLNTLPEHAILKEQYTDQTPSTEELTTLKKDLDVYLNIDLDKAIHKSRQENEHSLLWFVIDRFEKHVQGFFRFFPKSPEDKNFKKIFSDLGEDLIRQSFLGFKDNLEKKLGFKT